MMPALLRHYRIEHDRSRSAVVPASAQVFPLHTPRDYARMTARQSDAQAPVLLNHAQYFVFLSQLADALWQTLGERTRLFIQVRTPSTGPLRENLLRPEVLLGSNLLREAAFWAEHGSDGVVWVADRIRRDLDYPTDNSLSCVVWPASSAAAVDAILSRSWPEHAIKISRGVIR